MSLDRYRKHAANRALGRETETIAADFLRKKGLRLLERNYRCRIGEIDLICRDGTALVFVEVKSRGSLAYGPAALAVNPRKQERLVKIARWYLLEKKYAEQSMDVRFDVVGMEKSPQGWICHHYRHAFLSA